MTERLEKLGGLNTKETEAIQHQYKKSRELLDEIRTPHLLHTDLWEGNVLLNQRPRCKQPFDSLLVGIKTHWKLLQLLIATEQCMEIKKKASQTVSNVFLSFGSLRWVWRI